jgi:hypothetical protein
MEEYDAAAANHIGSSKTSELGINDQRYLAIAIAKSSARPVHLAEYMNFALFETIVTYSPPIVYHGRIKWMELLHRSICDGWDTKRDYHVRLWLPNIRGILPAGVRRSDPVLAAALTGRRLYNEVRQRMKANWSLR